LTALARKRRRKCVARPATKVGLCIFISNTPVFATATVQQTPSSRTRSAENPQPSGSHRYILASTFARNFTCGKLGEQQLRDALIPRVSCYPVKGDPSAVYRHACANNDCCWQTTALSIIMTQCARIACTPDTMQTARSS